MKGTLITKTKNSMRLALSPSDKFSHYLPALFVMLIGLFPLWGINEIVFLDSYNGVRSVEELFSFTWPWLILGVILLVIQWRRLKMRKIKLVYTVAELQESLSRTVEEMGWNIDINNNSVIVAYRPWNWTGSWGERVTILKLKDGLLLNSICDPRMRPSLTSVGWNKKNLKAFEKNLIAVQNGEIAKIRSDEIANESEWTVKKVLMRLVTYPLSLFFIALFGFFVYLNMNMISIVISVIPAGLAIVYLYSDLKIISAKRKLNA